MQVAWERVRVAIHSAGRVRCEPGWTLPASWGQRLLDFDLWFVWAGRGRMTLADRQVALRPGVCIWARPGRHYEATQDPDDRLGVSFIHFDLLDARRRLQRVAAPLPPEVTDLRDVPLFDATMRRIVELCREGPLQHAARQAAEALMTALLMDLDYQSSHQPAAAGIERLHRQLALELAAHIDENPADAAPVAHMARHAGYSPDHFTRIFKSVIGQSPQSYTINARINRARSLLLESEMSIQQIADVLGYDDVFFFSRQFKQRVGQTPTAYRWAGFGHAAGQVTPAHSDA